MKKFLISSAAIFSLLFGTLAMASPALAETCGSSSSSGNSITGNNSSTPVGISVGCTGSGNPIYDYLRGIIKFVSGAIGLAAVLMIVISGIQYMTSAGNPGAIAAAKGRLTNAIVGLILFVLLFAIANFLIPGGVLG